MVFSLLIPIIHVTWAVSEKDDIEDTFKEIGKLRNYYTQFVAMAEGEFGADKYRSYEAAVFEENYLAAYNKEYLAESTALATSEVNNQSYGKRINYLTLFISIYLFGVLFFIVRLIVLLHWLSKTIKSNPRQVHKNYQLVLMEKEIPPFSFFHYIFVNKDSTQLNEFGQILTHERVHVGQLHSLDLIIAHVITVFQWFNPLVWHLQKAIKTTHEYIADSKVVNQGFELFDYQSLLLSQLVSIQSVELVNNFNLISIKKRIAMMTKNKSRFTAKLKALFVIPVAIIVFFLFADMTVKSPVLNFTNFSSAKVSNLDGIWMNNSDSYGKLLKFEGNKLSILESAAKIDVVDLNITIKDKAFQVNSLSHSNELINYQLFGSTLKIWWSENDYSTYEKTNFKNSFEVLVSEDYKGEELPLMKETRILDNPDYLINIFIKPKVYNVDGVSCTLKELKKVLQERIGEFNKLDRPFITTRIVLDKTAEMYPVYDLSQIMREISLLKVAYGTFPTDKNASVLQYHMAGIPQMLPPLDAEVLERSDIDDVLIEINPGGDLTKKAQELEAFVLAHPDYIAAYDWFDDTKYGDYVAIVDMVYTVLYKLRGEFAMEKYNMPYTDLPKNLQNEVRKKYPMRLSQANKSRE